MLWVMLKPNPVPSPTALVVKKGSKIWGRISSAIPQPLSATLTMNFVTLPFRGDCDQSVLAIGGLDGLHGVDQEVQEHLIELCGRTGHQGKIAEVFFIVM